MVDDVDDDAARLGMSMGATSASLAFSPAAAARLQGSAGAGQTRNRAARAASVILSTSDLENAVSSTYQQVRIAFFFEFCEA